MNRLGHLARLFTLLGLLIASVGGLHGRPAQASTQVQTFLWGSLENGATTINIHVCGDGAMLQIRSEEIGSWFSEIFERTGSPECDPPLSPSWKIVIGAVPDVQYRVYAAMGDQAVNPEAFMMRAERFICTVPVPGSVDCVREPHSFPRILVDNPIEQQVIRGAASVGGWAADLASLSDSGVDQVRLYITPSDGLERDLGLVTYGLQRDDVASTFGDARFRNTGYGAPIDTTLYPDGTAVLRLEMRSTLTGALTSATRTVIIDNNGTTTGGACAPNQFRAEYFNSTTIGVAPAHAECVAEIDYNWGDFSPHPLVNVEGFSARYTGNIVTAAGERTFYVSADDGVRLWVDDELLIDRWYEQAGPTYWATRTLAAGEHSIRIEYYENTVSASLRFWHDTDPPPFIPTVPANCPPHLFRAEYFDNPDLSGTPAAGRCEHEIDYDWRRTNIGYNIGANFFSARWTMRQTFAAGHYSFQIDADDGVRLWVDDTLVIDGWGGSGLHTGSANLTAGEHSLRIEYRELSEAAHIRLAPLTTLSSLSPNQAVANAGPVPVVVHGLGLQEIVSVQVGRTPLQQVVLEGQNTLYGVLPVDQLAEGTYDVLATLRDGRQLTLPDAFKVTPAIAPTRFRVMLVLACDEPELETECGALFNQLELAMAAEPDLRVVVLWDGPQDGDSAYYLVQPDTTNNSITRESYQWGVNRFRIENGTDEVDTGDPATHVIFGGFAQARFPGEYKLLGFVGHGGGWAPDLRPPQPRYIVGLSVSEVGGMLWDFTSNSTLPTSAMSNILKHISAGYTLDVLYLDACLMANLEVVAEVSSYATYTVAHEGITWAFHPYDAYLSGITSKTTPDSFAKQIAAVFESELKRHEQHPGQIGVVKNDALGPVLSALNDLARLLLDQYREDGTVIGAVRRAATQGLRVDANNNWVIRPEEDAYLDLSSFSALLAKDPQLPDDVRLAAHALDSAVQAAILDSRGRSGRPWPTSSVDEYWDTEGLVGLSIYFPLSDEARRPHYGPTALPVLAGETAWDEFIQWWYRDSQPLVWSEGVCRSCLPLQRGIGVFAEPPATSLPGKVIYVPVRIHNARDTDNVRGFEFELRSSDLSLITPADREVRLGTFFPEDGLFQLTRTEAGWFGVINTRRFRNPAPRGSAVVVELPFLTSGEGCADLTLIGSMLVNGDAEAIAHHVAGGRVCVNTISVAGTVYLEGRPSGTYGDVVVELRGGGQKRATTTDEVGRFQFLDVPPGKYTLHLSHPLYMFAERSFELRTPGELALSPIGMWAGDLDQNASVGRADWRLCAVTRILGQDMRFDVNADQLLDDRDCTLVARNRGRENMPTTNPPRPGIAASAGTLTSAAGLAGSSHGLEIIQGADGRLTLRSAEGGAPIFAFGAVIRLPAGALVTAVDLPAPFAEARASYWVQRGAVLYLVAAHDADDPVAPGKPLAMLTMVGAGEGQGQAQIEDALVESQSDSLGGGGPESQMTLYLPVIRR